MLEGEKNWGGVVIGGDDMLSHGWNRVNWSAKYWEGGGGSGSGSGITDIKIQIHVISSKKEM